MKANNEVRAHAMLWFTTLIGGFNYTISKIAMPQYISPAGILVLRGIATILLFGSIMIFFNKEKIDKNDYFRLVLCGIFGVVGNQIMFYEGLNLTTPINASLMITAVPVTIFIISSVTRNEKFTFTKTIGILVGLTGTVLLILNSSQTSISALYIGDILVLINSFSWALFLITVKPLLTKYKTTTLVTWMFCIGFLVILPYGYKDFSEIHWSSMPTKAYLSILFIIIFATLCAYYFNIIVLKYVPPSLAGSYAYLQPVIASIIAVIWGVDYFTFEKFMYAVLIFCGVYLVSIPSTKFLNLRFHSMKFPTPKIWKNNH